MNEGERLEEFTSKLTPRQKEVVVLVGGEGLTYREAAERLDNRHRKGDNVSPETVRKYARDIRDMLGKKGPPQRAMWQLYRAAGSWLDRPSTAPRRRRLDRPTELYRCYSETGELLYIGVTISTKARFRHHFQGTEWWGEVHRVEVHHYADRESALEAERAAIGAEAPKYNLEHQTTATTYLGYPKSVGTFNG